MLNIFKKFFDYNEKDIQRLQKKVEEINELEEEARALKTQDFAKITEKLKDEVQSGKKTLDEILPWSYALVREAARRTLGQRHYDVQMIAAIALHEGKIAEQKTGEGKTLSATAPLYLNALEGKGVHLVTVNDYLAKIGAGWNGQLYKMLGMTVSVLISDESFIFDTEYRDNDAYDWRLVNLKPVTRDEAYAADITYGINSEFGFDYLRDNMATHSSEIRQRDFHYAIIDEVDSVLIDEARTPHIISAPYDEDTSKYYEYARIVERLDLKTDFIVDEKLKTAHLTEGGIAAIEKQLGTTNIYEKDYDTLFYVEAALKAKTLFKLDKDYIVKDDEVIIVDEFTGRLLQGRRFSEGLHQAIEAKEGVAIKRESKTLATVSLQNYFRMYEKLAGMTGTAATEAEEFHKIYNVDVLAIPTHRPMVRVDHPDLIYKTENGKFKALVEEIAAAYKVGRPVLVGTTSIEKNEIVSRLLIKKGIPHELLNAKNHEREAMIISNAGKKNAITIATNMAGRGVDIILGGMQPTKEQFTGNKPSESEGRLQEKFNKEMLEWQKNHDEVVKLGGLYVIGTERHESRRIDNQLRGRAGRQGDPGESRFFVALEDDLMRIFGGEQVSKLMDFFKIPEDQPLEHAMVSKALEQSQVKVEGFNFDTRKHLVEYDDVINKQREILYSLRRRILMAEENEKEVEETISNMYGEEVKNILNMFLYIEDASPEYRKIVEEFCSIVPLDPNKILKDIEGIDKPKVEEYLLKTIDEFYKSKEKEFGKELWVAVIQSIYLSTIDKYWTEHLTAIDDLREGINLRGYAQLDPLTEYKNEAFSMFEKLLSGIDFETARRLFHVQRVEEAPAEETKQKKIQFKSASATDPFSSPEKTSPPARTTSPQKKLGRNDPCWCGRVDENGKPVKYKKCHYPN
ncbi:preprotein translocase subunit SecA [Candidatus Roizmanbacteria bacterium RIFCSPHIGHO2_01_FULL_39_12b]|uniref:Protein translocase subunit SecA n=1 Tax=Candidatus Roizmanbacteria bacterium RIFCSPHIGHO2_01_FULL_39_12b TaxID=1802030 RepID=A0A1F7GFG9_9BACT|nr:MAG: preprotein translocase subunit SecA [Candidatus Roizmanbacteria bacterium RIFCSPHIGHO2_01_FULL_39_12b]OGK47050.1 MAG: preprotein translocase subunit SecA [Candidatus Roizmanbacteria bacterium RIFCSPLOWO2_01_FULL_39_19]